MVGTPLYFQSFVGKDLVQCCTFPSSPRWDSFKSIQCFKGRSQFLPVKVTSQYDDWVPMGDPHLGQGNKKVIAEGLELCKDCKLSLSFANSAYLTLCLNCTVFQTALVCIEHYSNVAPHCMPVYAENPDS